MGDTNLIIVFTLAVVTLLAIDLFVVGRKAHVISTKEAGIWTLIFVGVSLLFAWYIYIDQGKPKAMEFLSAYVIEKTLSVDNLFVFILVFAYFKVPKQYHHKVLFWGIIGAIVLRAIFIFSGVQLVKLTYVNILGYNINIVLMAFGAFLLYAGIKAGIEALNDIPDEEEQNFDKSPGARLIRKIFRGKVSKDYDGDKFVTKQPITETPSQRTIVTSVPYVRYIKVATPLLVVVGVVELTDLLFAVDSIPAIFSVSSDPFILYSSNIFAILGLRSMYFLLANMLPLFKYLNHGLALILAFIGAKMVAAPWFHISGNLSLYIVVGILAISVGVSLLTYKKEEVKEA
jgi:tellurite resistance protein TerC